MVHFINNACGLFKFLHLQVCLLSCLTCFKQVLCCRDTWAKLENCSSCVSSEEHYIGSPQGALQWQWLLLTLVRGAGGTVWRCVDSTQHPEASVLPLKHEADGHVANGCRDEEGDEESLLIRGLSMAALLSPANSTAVQVHTRANTRCNILVFFGWCSLVLMGRCVSVVCLVCVGATSNLPTGSSNNR